LIGLSLLVTALGTSNHSKTAGASNSSLAFPTDDSPVGGFTFAPFASIGNESDSVIKVVISWARRAVRCGPQVEHGKFTLGDSGS